MRSATAPEISAGVITANVKKNAQTAMSRGSALSGKRIPNSSKSKKPSHSRSPLPLAMLMPTTAQTIGTMPRQ